MGHGESFQLLWRSKALSQLSRDLRGSTHLLLSPLLPLAVMLTRVAAISYLIRRDRQCVACLLSNSVGVVTTSEKVR